MEPVDEAARVAFKKAGLKVPEPVKASKDKEAPEPKGGKGKTLAEAAKEEGFVSPAATRTSSDNHRPRGESAPPGAPPHGGLKR
jgi:hypothetical protein